MTRWWRIVAAGLAVAVLGGCASVPTSGPIQQGPPLTADDQELIYRAIPQPPQPGMAPDEVVRGFLAASSSGSDAYGVARSFLTPRAAAAWDPLASVRVYDNSGITTKLATDSVTVSGVLDGTIGPDGGYGVATGGQRLDVSYRLARIGSEWRISQLPPGLVLGRGDVDREFRTYNLYFFDPTFSVLVPDPITVPVVGSGLPTTLVRALLHGPTQWLAPAVRTAFPEGTALALDSVPVDQGIAQVELSSQVLGASDKTRAALSAQLVWTLRRLPNVTGVRITVNGQPLTLPGAGPVQDTTMWQSYDADAPASAPPPTLAAGRTGLVKITDGAAPAPITGQLGVGHPLVVSPALSADGTQIAAVSAADRRELWVQSVSGTPAPRRVIAGATDLSRPSWDRTGALWVVDRGGRGLLMIVDDKPVAVPIVDLPGGAQAGGVVGVSISPDGTRGVLLMRRAGRVEPWLARVERDGSTVRLAAPRRLETSVVDAYDVDWSTVDQFAVLGTDGADATKLFLVSSGFDRVVIQSVPAGSTGVAVAPGEPVLVAGEGRLYRQSGGSWIDVGEVTDPAYAD